MIPTKYLWYGVAIVMVLLGLSFRNVIELTPSHLDALIESVRASPGTVIY